MMLAGERPDLVKGIVNFVGGWIGVTDRLTAEENQQRMDKQKAMLTSAAKRTSAPSVWFYAARDPFYKEGVPQELHRYWLDAGGRGQFVFIDNHSLRSGHVIATEPTLWERQADALLKSIESVKP